MSLHQSSGNWRLGLALSLLTVFLWGVLPIALTVALQGLDAYTVTWFRFLVSFVLLGVYLSARKQLPSGEKLLSLPKGLFLTAVIFLALNYILYLLGLSYTTPANAQVLIQLAPVLMGLGGIYIFKERYTLIQWIGLAGLTLGFVLFFNEQLKTLITSQGKYLFGSGLIIIAAITWAIYGLAQKQLLQQLSSANIMLLIYGSCALIFAPFANPQPILSLNLLQFSMLLFCALNTIVAYGAFAESLEHWEASRVSAVLAAAPIVTLASVWAVALLFPQWIFTNNLTILGVLGAILVVVGSMTIALGKKS
ncbi:EamA family transporter [[Phormidium ambiguum] IAM M-71]|uniref:EamA family transporter n=1 Tax=[Phormidium ambiguum] IAM M-71 TaxID=454136 RepID=A0A1U7ISS4_9CYAN|nr:DMT family transporter [Phormidium ambiguum]OKH40475.1 EamA family transporter [Phormidium ambiguum IAM M-71]